MTTVYQEPRSACRRCKYSTNGHVTGRLHLVSGVGRNNLAIGVYPTNKGSATLSGSNKLSCSLTGNRLSRAGVYSCSVERYRTESTIVFKGYVRVISHLSYAEVRQRQSSCSIGKSTVRCNFNLDSCIRFKHTVNCTVCACRRSINLERVVSACTISKRNLCLLAGKVCYSDSICFFADYTTFSLNSYGSTRNTIIIGSINNRNLAVKHVYCSIQLNALFGQCFIKSVCKIRKSYCAFIGKKEVLFCIGELFFCSFFEVVNSEKRCFLLFYVHLGDCCLNVLFAHYNRAKILVKDFCDGSLVFFQQNCLVEWHACYSIHCAFVF